MLGTAANVDICGMNATLVFEGKTGATRIGLLVAQLAVGVEQGGAFLAGGSTT